MIRKQFRGVQVSVLQGRETPKWQSVIFEDLSYNNWELLH